MLADLEEQPQELRRWMTARLRDGTHGAHVLAALAVIFVAYLLYAGTQVTAILHWAAYLLACEALLGLTMLAQLRLRHWVRLYATFHLAACAGWGIVPLLFLEQMPQAYQSLYALVVLAAAVVALPTMSYMPRLYLAGVTLMLAPVAAGLALGDSEHPTVSLVLALFMMVAIIALAWRTRQAHADYTERAREALSLRQARLSLRAHQQKLHAEQQRAEQAEQWDAVTGTRSQAAFLGDLHHLHPERHDAAVCFKIAGFKYVNMAFGHDIGDEVLREMAARLVKLAGDSARVCRTGGGEFLAYIAHPPRGIEQQLMRICEEPCLTARGTVVVNAYIGLSSLESGEKALDATHSAIHAAENAKQDGDKEVRRLAPADVAQQRNRSLMRFELRDALSRDEFHLTYQPQHELGSRALCGFEALLRWESPAFGPVSPGEFIPIAEEAGIIRELGAWVMRHAISEFSQHFHQSAITLSVNVSLFQLEADDFVSLVREALSEAGLPARRLTVEITESTFMASPAVISERLQTLRELGVRVALDDFGTGYSSLSYLTRIPLDEVKIDRAFVEEVADSTVSHTLVTSLLQICNALRLRAVLEGVEYPRQMEALSEFRDTVIQGYVFSRPVSIKSAAAYALNYSESA